jgi:L-lactate dehydrogenase complex protein LldG
MTAREEFLNRIANRLGRPRRSGVMPPKWELTPYEHLHRGRTKEGLIEQFIANLRILQANVLHVTPDQIEDALEKVLAASQAHSVIYWNDERLRDLGVPAFLAQKGITHQKWDTACDEQELRRYAADTSLGIVYAEIGLSETGTVMLWNGGGRGRVVSLLPPAFVVVLEETNIVPRLTEAVEYVHTKVPEGLPACINFITGPSRTGDIEMDLALGVHGPGNVFVILVKK